MKRTVIAAVILSGSMSAFAVGYPSGYGPIPFDTALAAAKGDGKPIMLFYSQTSCGPCMRMRGFLDTSVARNALAGKVHAVVIDTNHTPALLMSMMSKHDNFGLMRNSITGKPTPTPQIAFLASSGELLCSVRQGFNHDEHAAKVATWVLSNNSDYTHRSFKACGE